MTCGVTNDKEKSICLLKQSFFWSARKISCSLVRPRLYTLERIGDFKFKGNKGDAFDSTGWAYRIWIKFYYIGKCFVYLLSC